jgi:nitrite reductase/ring-hydroxylating ferredoxin subunit/uncharacterized membrane protein
VGQQLQRIEELVHRIGRTKQLDAPAGTLADAVNGVLGPTPLKNALIGTWLGHPVHPLLVAFPIGSWAGAAAFDLMGGEGAEDAADALTALGLLSAVPTVATGLASWSDLFGADRRIGLVHAASNAVAAGCFAASLVQRRRGRRGIGVLWHTAGMGAMTVGGWLGGHLTYRLGAGVDHTVFEERPESWTTVAQIHEVVEGKPHLARAEGTAIMLVRTGTGVVALSDVCSHESGPLHEGEITDGCITCPWHGSRFRLTDGGVVRGPATAPQPAYDVRIHGDDVQVRARVG